MPKQISGAVQADADVVNAVETPVPGCTGSFGTQILIPGDYVTRIAAGQAVPGCTYASLDGSTMWVDDVSITRLNIPAIVNALPAGQKAQAVLLNLKLAAAIAVS